MLRLTARHLALPIALLTATGCPQADQQPTAPTEDGITLSPTTSQISVDEDISLNCVSSKSGAAIPCSKFTIGDGSILGEAESDFIPVGIIDVYGKKDGQTTVVATSESGRTGSAIVRVHALVVTVTPASASLSPEQSTVLHATVTDFRGNPVSLTGDGKAVVTWEANPSDGVSVAPNGVANATATVIGKKAGTTVVSATLVDGPNTLRTHTFGNPGTATITVTAPAIPAQTGVIVASDIGLRLATPGLPSNTNQYTAIDPINDEVATGVTWKSSNEAVATIDATTGLATSLTGGEVTFTATWTRNGVPYTASKTVTVGPINNAAVASAMIVPDDNAKFSVKVGKVIAFACQGLDASGAKVPVTSVVWSSSDPTKASVTQSGIVTGVAAALGININCFINGKQGFTQISVTP
ncbi:MAG TPA: Ig-like domain-containing protein [Gemmatimonadaceae bacterium]|nr:Ig-like domain-containing protein [Gemmatimonadaceae bacterium]